ncbi:ABC transporter ATP-binding protein [Schauerella aestuarii]|uniref:ABC transporter ATP-binding protein n=1 Tax=Schauerella aestuarii TaxID=2511204 RepID=UPI00136E105B|nr:ABC transporter ATP-binding protein [Achromobacter aestuarii]MYZ44073.1 ABC transporter ATP-binding protein [Achromobacter aestuarii]
MPNRSPLPPNAETSSAIPPLQGCGLTLEYGRHVVIDGLDVAIPAAQITVLVGSNGCGKSTLLKALARLLKPAQGSVLLHGADIQRTPTVQVARELAVLPQTPVAPEGLTVDQLVRMGRYPHQTWLQQWSRADQDAVTAILHATDLYALKDRGVDSLSGGQRQRAWIAMTLAQDTDILLLDEPTTYLDLAHQIEVLDLLEALNADHCKTIVMVLHDLNLAARYAHHMIAVHDRGIFAQGPPARILDERMVKAVFDLDCRVIPDPLYGTPLCIPIGRRRRGLPDA